MISWSYDSLWQKTKLYIQRALDTEREGSLFPFWAALALELLGRATLAKVHPALLADPQQGENILYAFGYGNAKNPKSIPAKTVFTRCIVIVPNFTQEDFKVTMGMIERRNEELHAGSPAFEDLPTKLWLADYFRICNILLNFQNLGLSDLFGKYEALAAEQMLEAAENHVIEKAQKAIAEAQKKFKALSSADQEREKDAGSNFAQFELSSHAKLEICPSCNAQAIIMGKKVNTSEIKLQGDDILSRQVILLPTNFRCYSCNLSLQGYGELHAAGFGGQFSVKETYDPLTYYSADLDPADYYEPDYGND